MQREPVLAAALPLAVGVALIGLNVVSERWALARRDGGAQNNLAGQPCSSDGSAANPPDTDCFRVESSDGLPGLGAGLDVQSFFPAELLLIGMALVGVLTAWQKSENPYLTFAIVATLLGLIRAVLAGSVLLPMVYFIVIGAGFALGSLLFRRRVSA